MKMNPDAFHRPPEEEVTLCKAWVRISEDSVVCNMKREVGFWIEVLDYVRKKLNRRSNGGARSSTTNGHGRIEEKTVASKATSTTYIDEALVVFDNEERRMHCLFGDQKEGARNKAINVGNARI
uniref:Uncharacterized protein n=1 Tax=Tanacetum cinerariifolium TaxID=118510 RepID=A0A6L2JXR4_TANCI|nr:hypothetical protein [Tanacetum cinerariifolium]